MHPNPAAEVNYLQMCMKQAGKAWNYYLLSILWSLHDQVCTVAETVHVEHSSALGQPQAHLLSWEVHQKEQEGNTETT